MEDKVAPSKKKEENIHEIVKVYVDPELTGGAGINVNGKIFVGWVEVSKHQADDLMRIQREYQETVKRMHDPSSKITMKNSDQVERLYCANPKDYANNPAFSKEFGLLDPWQWERLPEPFKQYLKDMKKALYDGQ